MRKSLIALVIVLMSAPHVFAARPFATDDAGTVEPGIFELELSTEYVKASNPETNLDCFLTTGLL